MFRSLVLPLIAAFAGCGSQSVKPDDMSAADHRAEAARERDKARNEAATGGAGETPGPGVVAPGTTPMTRTPFYEPHPEVAKTGSPHLQAAEEHSRHAGEHERAAQALEAFEDAECRAIAPEERPSCPLLHDVVRIEDTAGGVRVVFADKVDVAEVVAHIRCHLAYSRTRAFADVEDCPLYVRGVKVAPAGMHAITLTADESETVQRIRRLSREEVLPAR
jgi:hypothetical protein